MRELPKYIGLCPDVSHADEFYMPLDTVTRDGRPHTCPYCPLELVVYEPVVLGAQLELVSTREVIERG
jgi:hypothetical protein